jgi:hypothetical protein
MPTGIEAELKAGEKRDTNLLFVAQLYSVCNCATYLSSQQAAAAAAIEIIRRPVVLALDLPHLLHGHPLLPFQVPSSPSPPRLR